jgi:hypothetical protein
MGAVARAAAVERPALQGSTGSAGLSPEEGVTAGEQPLCFGEVAGWADGRPEGATTHFTRVEEARTGVAETIRRYVESASTL